MTQLGHFFLIIFVILISIPNILCGLVVYGPEELKLQFQPPTYDINFTIAKFGEIPYGKKLAGNLYLASPLTGCSELNLTKMNYTAEEFYPQNIPIILAERGKCSYITKAKYAELAGAGLLIVYDNKRDVISDAIMNSDSNGDNIQIPSVLIGKLDGLKLKNYIQNNTETEIQIVSYFPLKPIGKPTYVDFWYSSGDPTSFKFLDEFKLYIAEQFYDCVSFIPHPVVWVSMPAKATNFTLNDPNCISGGRYCAPDPDGSGPGSGADVVLEDLHQICAYKILGPYGFLQYVYGFNKYCNIFKIENCTDSIYSNMPLLAEKYVPIESCVYDSFEGNDIRFNDTYILREEQAKFLEAGVSYFPALIINNKPYKNMLSPISKVIDAICDAIEPGHKNCVDVIDEDFGEQVIVEHDSIWEIAIVLIVTLVILIGGFMFYKNVVKRELKQEMNIQLKNIVGEYAAFVEKNRDRT